MLKHINPRDLYFDKKRPKIFTSLYFQDSEYNVCYTMTAEFPMKNHIIIAEFKHNNSIYCELNAYELDKENTPSSMIHCTFPIEIYEKYFKKYILKIIESWQSDNIKTTDTILIDFYNEIINASQNQTEYKETTDKIPTKQKEIIDYMKNLNNDDFQNILNKITEQRSVSK